MRKAEFSIEQNLLRQNYTRHKRTSVAVSLESELLEEPLVLAGLVSFLELELDGLDGLSFASLVLKNEW